MAFLCPICLLSHTSNRQFCCGHKICMTCFIDTLHSSQSAQAKSTCPECRVVDPEMMEAIPHCLGKRYYRTRQQDDSTIHADIGRF